LGKSFSVGLSATASVLLMSFKLKKGVHMNSIIRVTILLDGKVCGHRDYKSKTSYRKGLEFLKSYLPSIYTFEETTFYQ
jgi:hypothetical protein